MCKTLNALVKHAEVHASHAPHTQFLGLQWIPKRTCNMCVLIFGMRCKFSAICGTWCVIYACVRNQTLVRCCRHVLPVPGSLMESRAAMMEFGGGGVACDVWCLRVRLSVCIFVCLCVCVACVCMYVHIRACVFKHVWGVFAYVSVYVSVFMFVYDVRYWCMRIFRPNRLHTALATPPKQPQPPSFSYLCIQHHTLS